ncbi:uncharacterized protein si:ch211-13c6.2 isoform X2 [Lampris incognitus]|uniref:uncharacterized protein si:ch211-13c6.2 isoform X2 n=1 Tax=Lampris incognitus TaxID=2546036 RepID=UPI0024B5DC22|nr:uncharacterized protein si:ch211-13c6.2 isoform X2 [Lampris incognitus]
MDGLETPYDVDGGIDFIDCTICNKSISGNTLFKIHLTTAGHLKKEDALVVQGQAIRDNPVPDFEDFLQYLQYLDLDEPIIGMDYLEEVPHTDPSDSQPGPRYLCKMCNTDANLPNMATHVIGRKHRQKYLQTKRPDLVTWDKKNMTNQSGKIIRAKAEMVERQDGRGTPKPMRKNRIVGKLNISRDDTYMVAEPESGPYLREDTVQRGRMGKELWRKDYMERDSFKPEFTEDDCHRGYQEDYRDDSYREDDTHTVNFPWRETYPEDSFPREAPPYRRSNPESDPLKQFYSEEVRRGRTRSAVAAEPLRSAYCSRDPHGKAYPQDDSHRYPDQSEQVEQYYPDEGPGDQMYCPEEPSQDYPHYSDTRKSFIEPAKSQQPYDKDNLFEMIKALRKEKSDQQEVMGSLRDRGLGPVISQKPPGGARVMSDIPEPFRRFLEGTPNDQDNIKRKRKSRFSDATDEEVRRAKAMLIDDYKTPNPEVRGPRGPVHAPPRPGVYQLQKPDPYTKSQSIYQTESNPRGHSNPKEKTNDTGAVFDLLKNVDIDDMEEAEFLKSKLCNLLKEFNDKKSKKTMHYSQGPGVISKDYNHVSQSVSLRDQYERTFRKGPESTTFENKPRIPQEGYSQDAHRGRDWEEKEQISGERFQEYGHPEHNISGRSSYKEVFGSEEMYQLPHAPNPEDSDMYPERFQEPIPHRDYTPAKGPLDTHFSPPLYREQGHRMYRAPQHSSSLDKITSTLLELVARK